MLTTDLPTTDAVPLEKTQAAPGCCSLTCPFIGSITRRRARFGPSRPPPAGGGEVVPARSGYWGWSEPSTRSESAASGSPAAIACRALSASSQVIHRPQPEAQQHPGQLITALACGRGRAVPQCHYLLEEVPLRCSTRAASAAAAVRILARTRFDDGVRQRASRLAVSGPLLRSSSLWGPEVCLRLLTWLKGKRWA
jgi:hypothetical protein